jgi:hypothetical protein
LNFLVYRRPVYLRHRKIDPTLSPLGAWRKALRFNFQNETIAELERRSMTINTVPGGQNANPNSNSNPNHNNNNNDDDNISKIDPPPLSTTITRAVGSVVQDKQHQQPEYDEVMGSSSSLLLLLGDTNIASASKTNTVTLEHLSTYPTTTLLKEEDTAPQEPLQQQQQQQVPIGSSSTENEMDHNSTTTNVEGRRYHTALKE